MILTEVIILLLQISHTHIIKNLLSQERTDSGNAQLEVDTVWPYPLMNFLGVKI